jgi:hypothetical protein
MTRWNILNFKYLGEVQTSLDFRGKKTHMDIKSWPFVVRFPHIVFSLALRVDLDANLQEKVHSFKRLHRFPRSRLATKPKSAPFFHELKGTKFSWVES